MFPSLHEGLEFIHADFRDPALIAQVGFDAYPEDLARSYGYDILLPVRFLFSATPYAGKRSCPDILSLMRCWIAHHPGAFQRFMDDLLEEGRSRLEAGDSPRARSIFELLSAVDHRSFAARKGLGDASLACGDRESALTGYRAAQALRPTDEGLRILIDPHSGDGDADPERRWRMSTTWRGRKGRKRRRQDGLDSAGRGGRLLGGS